MPQILTAVRFEHFMKSGRTTPAILGCEDSSGASAGEYVVKLRGGIETRDSGLLRELLASELADYFGIASPQPALIRIEQSLAELISEKAPAHTACILDSIGLNFGTKLVIGYSTWPVDKPILDTTAQTAADIFAFDAFVQNPDRRFDNPNLLVNGDNVLIIDHEMAFSFLLNYLPISNTLAARERNVLARACLL